jgi:F-type H+-transporting ATPase subunit gamma
LANILDIRRRIRSVKNTRQITKAMKMVSAAKLRRAQERALTARPYAGMLTNVLKSLVSRAEIYDPVTGEARNPLLVRREEKNILLLIVTGDKGLAGAFNTNILKAASRFLIAKKGVNIDIETIGRKGRDFFRRRYKVAPKAVKVEESLQKPESSSAKEVRAAEIQIVGEHVGVISKPDFTTAREIAESIIERYTREEIDSVYLVYNEFKSVIAQRLIVDEILPIEQIGAQDIRQSEGMTEEQLKRAIEASKDAGVKLKPEDTKEADAKAATFATSQVDYIYEQPAHELFAGLLPKYVAIQIFRAMLESWAAFNAAQMTAMDSATSNASDMIDSLTLAMNRVRQAKITKEIIEIVSGAAAQ